MQSKSLNEDFSTDGSRYSVEEVPVQSSVQHPSRPSQRLLSTQPATRPLATITKNKNKNKSRKSRQFFKAIFRNENNDHGEEGGPSPVRRTFKYISDIISRAARSTLMGAGQNEEVTQPGDNQIADNQEGPSTPTEMPFYMDPRSDVSKEPPALTPNLAMGDHVGDGLLRYRAQDVNNKAPWEGTLYPNLPNEPNDQVRSSSLLDPKPTLLPRIQAPLPGYPFGLGAPPLPSSALPSIPEEQQWPERNQRLRNRRSLDSRLHQSEKSFDFSGTPKSNRLSARPAEISHRHSRGYPERAVNEVHNEKDDQGLLNFKRRSNYMGFGSGFGPRFSRHAPIPTPSRDIRPFIKPVQQKFEVDPDDPYSLLDSVAYTNTLDQATLAEFWKLREEWRMRKQQAMENKRKPVSFTLLRPPPKRRRIEEGGFKSVRPSAPEYVPKRTNAIRALEEFEREKAEKKKEEEEKIKENQQKAGKGTEKEEERKKNEEGNKWNDKEIKKNEGESGFRGDGVKSGLPSASAAVQERGSSFGAQPRPFVPMPPRSSILAQPGQQSVRSNPVSTSHGDANVSLPSDPGLGGPHAGLQFDPSGTGTVGRSGWVGSLDSGGNRSGMLLNDMNTNGTNLDGGKSTTNPNELSEDVFSSSGAAGLPLSSEPGFKSEEVKEDEEQDATSNIEEGNGDGDDVYKLQPSSQPEPTSNLVSTAFSGFSSGFSSFAAKQEGVQKSLGHGELPSGGSGSGSRCELDGPSFETEKRPHLEAEGDAGGIAFGNGDFAEKNVASENGSGDGAASESGRKGAAELPSGVIGDTGAPSVPSSTVELGPPIFNNIAKDGGDVINTPTKDGEGNVRTEIYDLTDTVEKKDEMKPSTIEFKEDEVEPREEEKSDGKRKPSTSSPPLVEVKKTADVEKASDLKTGENPFVGAKFYSSDMSKFVFGANPSNHVTEGVKDGAVGQPATNSTGNGGFVFGAGAGASNSSIGTGSASAIESGFSFGAHVASVGDQEASKVDKPGTTGSGFMFGAGSVAATNSAFGVDKAQEKGGPAMANTGFAFGAGSGAATSSGFGPPKAGSIFGGLPNQGQVQEETEPSTTRSGFAFGAGSGASLSIGFGQSGTGSIFGGLSKQSQAQEKTEPATNNAGFAFSAGSGAAPSIGFGQSSAGMMFGGKEGHKEGQEKSEPATNSTTTGFAFGAGSGAATTTGFGFGNGGSQTSAGLGGGFGGGNAFNAAIPSSNVGGNGGFGLNSGPSFGASGPSFGTSGPSFGASGPSFGASGPSFGASGPSFGASGPSFGVSSPSFGLGNGAVTATTTFAGAGGGNNAFTFNTGGAGGGQPGGGGAFNVGTSVAPTRRKVRVRRTLNR